MRAIFRDIHSTVADLQHVRIVPVPRASVGFETVLQVENPGEAHGIFLLAIPATGNVARGAPEIPDVLGPEPGLAGAPFAQAENDGPPAGSQGIAHGGVRGLRVFLAR